MRPFVGKKKALCLIYHISTKKLPTLFFQPRPTPLLFHPPPPPIINSYNNVQPPLLFKPFLLFGTREYNPWEGISKILFKSMLGVLCNSQIIQNNKIMVAYKQEKI